ncbi:trigger factor [Effusibacillus lacus]|uniref:Trigger factor n=1 Tax=Effusibacillus lacus TaxID=1348429 RepID=A0A292YQD0_9BACL|nr:trigger factor [Effusibacillus lacus]TCS70050.1 trigger factor [Effusibacillus lacus]GAX91111.1 trigger factor [Effusibacillus lacus]
MSAKWEKKENNVGVLEVEVDSAKVDQAIDQAFKKVVKRVNVPGFRKGKVPRKIFEQRFGVAVLYEDALDILLPQAYSQAVSEANIEPVARPDIDIVQLEQGKPLIFKATVTVKPEVKLGEYKGVEVEKKEFAVTAEDVQKELENLQKSHAEIIVLEEGTVENGDIVIIDFKGFVNGEAFEGGEAEKYQLEVGSGTFIPGFEDQLIGLAKGEDKDIEVTFPENYHVEKLAGQPAVFKIHLHEIKRKQLPALDDEFAKDISEFDTLDELKSDLEKKLKERAENEKKSYLEDKVLEKAVTNATIDLPAVMIDNEVDSMLEDFKQRLQMQGIPYDAYLQFTGSSEDKLRSEMKGNAENRVRTRLVLEEISKVEQIEATEDDLSEEIAKIADQARMDFNQVKEILESRDPQLLALKSDIVTRKTISFLVENSKVS